MDNNENNSGISFWKWLVKNLLGLVALVLAIALVAGFLLKLTTRHGKEITVPDLSNMSVSEAKYTAAGENLRIEVTDSVYIRRMGRGLVYSQNPKAGAKVKKGRRILLTINSVTPKKVQMPNLVGYSMRQAKAELLSRGLNLGKLIYVDDIATNNVLKQIHGSREIRPGVQIESGSDIDLVLGLNEEDKETYIPETKGLKYMRAVDVIHDASLNVQKAVFDATVKDYSDSLDAVVYSQTPEASAELPVDMGSEITIYLSLDPLKR